MSKLGQQDDLESQVKELQKDMQLLMKDRDDLLQETGLGSLSGVGKQIKILHDSKERLSKQIEEKSNEIKEKSKEIEMLTTTAKGKDEKISSLEQEIKRLKKQQKITVVSLEQKSQTLKSGLSDIEQFFIDRDFPKTLEILWHCFMEINKKIEENANAKLSSAEAEFLTKFATIFVVVQNYSELNTLINVPGLSANSESKKDLENKRDQMKKKYKITDNNLVMINQNIDALIQRVTSNDKEEFLRKHEEKESSWCMIL